MIIMNNKQFEELRDFMNEHPDNKDAVIVMDGNIEDIARQIAQKVRLVSYDRNQNRQHGRWNMVVI